MDFKSTKESIMYKKLIGSAVLAFSLAASANVFAACGCPTEGFRKMVDSVNLDATQKEKIKPIMENLRTSMKSNVESLKDINSQLKDQVTAATYNESAVSGLVDKKTQILGTMMKAKMLAKSQVYALLTPEQRTMLQTKMKALREKMEERFQSCHAEE